VLCPQGPLEVPLGVEGAVGYGWFPLSASQPAIEGPLEEAAALVERFLDAAGRVLTPDGVLLISTPDRASTPPFVNGRPKNQFHIREWYGDEFCALLGGYFAEVKMHAQVETTALRSRTAAIAALHQVLRWHSPVAAFFLRRRPFRSRYWRTWKQVADLAAPSVSDYPIVALPVATLFGATAFHIAICRKPRSHME
jgi:SAM-dependent methyltransferase